MAQKAEIRSTLPDKIKTILGNFWGMALIFSGIVILFRFLELYLIFDQHVLNFSLRDVLFKSFVKDLNWLLYFFGLLMIVYLILSLLSIKISKITLNLIFLIAITLQVSLILYFVKTLQPLGSDVFAYSYDDLVITVSSSGVLSPLMIFLSFVSFLVIGFVLWYGSNRINLSLKSYLWMTGIGLVSLFFFLIFPLSDSESVNENRFNVEQNKTNFLVQQSFNYFMFSDDYYFDFYLRPSGKNLTVQKNFTDNNYPFMHTANYPDVLSPFFDTLNSKPDIVFIFVESLGRAYSGEDAYLGSFTPYLDSLSNFSLVWDNAISSTGRTFGVLPGVFGGLPFGQNGFLEFAPEFPKHDSFLSILKENNYSVEFYIGSDKNFDNEGDFLIYQNVDRIIDQGEYGSQYQKTPSSTGFSWGYPDKDMFSNGLDKLPASDTLPQVRIFQTQTSHDPYRVPTPEVFGPKLRNHLENYLEFSENKIQDYLSYQDIYMTILYADEAIKEFMEEYSKRPEFENTIFVITGDHRLPEVPMSSRLDRFHVPLIIYSPKLKRNIHFKGLTSHFEISPSLLSFLDKQVGLNQPDEVVWLGQVFDTAQVFQSKVAMPLMRNKNQLVDYINEEYFLSDGQLFLISDGLNIDPINDNQNLTRLIGEFEEFKNRNNYLIQTSKLLPDELE
ncbi:sulfatase-like hydrolase/transferase [Algoriphagus sp.]|uniref:LTA synthase family protein n=1 Tax=Algoriphagus sp. TaxID=1872435 RepID=UPI0025D0E144|nr:sulfatase-like hydrolase/transferase [Algoriphagus sp.]